MLRSLSIGLVCLLCATLVRADDKAKEAPADIAVTFVSIDGDVLPTLTFTLTNTSGKDIDAIKGGIYAYDRFGDLISPLGFGVEVDEAIKAGGTYKEAGRWACDARLKKLLSTSPKDVTFKWETKKVAFKK